MPTHLSQQKTLASPWLTEAHAQENALLQKALAGENVRDEIVLYLQPRLIAMAARMYDRLAQGMRRGNVIERGDLINSANVAILDCYETALTKENPFGYLFQTARISMLHYLNGRTGNPINSRNQREHITVLSLDFPKNDGQTLADELTDEFRLPGRSEHKSLAVLLQAIDALPEKQRMVVRHYHGFGQAPQSLNQLNKLFTNSPHTGIARRYYQQALKTLRQELSFSSGCQTEAFQLCHTGGTRS